MLHEFEARLRRTALQTGRHFGLIRADGQQLINTFLPPGRPLARSDPALWAFFGAGAVFNGANVIWNGDGSAVADDQAELSPAGGPTRHLGLIEPEDEYAPPGN